MIKASFSEDGQFYQYKDKEEYNHIIRRLFTLMKCENEQGIANFLRIELSEVVSAKNNNIIPTDWFKRYYFVIYTMVDEIKNGKKYNDKYSFHIEYEKFMSKHCVDSINKIILFGKGIMLNDDSYKYLSVEDIAIFIINTYGEIIKFFKCTLLYRKEKYRRKASKLIKRRKTRCRVAAFQKKKIYRYKRNFSLCVKQGLTQHTD